MKKVFYLVILSFVFLYPINSYCQEAVYCGQILKFDSKASSKQDTAVIIFNEMQSVDDDTFSYTKQLPNKPVSFALAKEKLSVDEYVDLLEMIIKTMHDKSMCITVDTRSKKVLSIVAGG